MSAFSILDKVTNTIYDRIVEDMPDAAQRLVVGISKEGFPVSYRIRASTIIDHRYVEVVKEIPYEEMDVLILPEDGFFMAAENIGDKLLTYHYTHKKEDYLD